MLKLIYSISTLFLISLGSNSALAGIPAACNLLVERAALGTGFGSQGFTGTFDDGHVGASAAKPASRRQQPSPRGTSAANPTSAQNTVQRPPVVVGAPFLHTASPDPLFPDGFGHARVGTLRLAPTTVVPLRSSTTRIPTGRQHFSQASVELPVNRSSIAARGSKMTTLSDFVASNLNASGEHQVHQRALTFVDAQQNTHVIFIDRQTNHSIAAETQLEANVDWQFHSADNLDLVVLVNSKGLIERVQLLKASGTAPEISTKMHDRSVPTDRHSQPRIQVVQAAFEHHLKDRLAPRVTFVGPEG